jgi:hypothetical protein
VTAPADWLTERPPLPRRELTPLYEQALAAAKQILADVEARESTAVLYRVEELERVLEPTWPAVEPVEDGTVPGMPHVTVESAVKPPRWSRQWWVENLSFSRVVWAGSSAVVLLVTGLGWIQ